MRHSRTKKSIKLLSNLPPFQIAYALVVLLLISNIVLFVLFINETRKTRQLMYALSRKEAGPALSSELRQKPDAKTKEPTVVAQAKKEQAPVAVPVTPPGPAQAAKPSEPVAPPPKPAGTPVAPSPPVQPAKVPEPAAPPAKTATAPAAPAPVIKPTAKTLRPNEIPSPLIHAAQGEYALFCEKESKTLYLFRHDKNNFKLVKAYPCITGANNKNKQTNGDLATPEGVFFFLRYISGKDLPEQYGAGAFVLNYPNFLARKEGKKGNGIWLHGHSADKNIGKDILNTKGCVVVENESLKEISRSVKTNGVPMVIVSKLETITPEKQNQLSKEIQAFMSSWKKSWESLNTEKYLSHYSPEFLTSDGMNYGAFKKHKEGVNKGKKFIRVETQDMAIFTPQEYGGSIAVVRFVQKYSSNNFKSESKKLFYLKKKESKWRIIAESLF